MKDMYCPVNFKKVNIYLIKFYSIIVAALLIMFILADWKLPIYILTIDFVLRVTAGIAYSPLCVLLDGILRFFRVCPRQTDARTKQFAAVVGMLFMFIISVLSFTHHHIIARLVAAFMLVVVLAEIMAGFCVACWVYSYYSKLKAGRRRRKNENIFTGEENLK